jgi:predicted Holliday junction resolvase-like endonuclease
MIYVIVTTLLALAGIGGTITAIRHYRAKVAAVSDELNEAIRASREQRKEIERLQHVIKAQQEVQLEAEEKKRKVRSHADPVDRANAATELMSDLSRGGDDN